MSSSSISIFSTSAIFWRTKCSLSAAAVLLSDVLFEQPAAALDLLVGHAGVLHLHRRGGASVLRAWRRSRSCGSSQFAVGGELLQHLLAGRPAAACIRAGVRGPSARTRSSAVRRADREDVFEQVAGQFRLADRLDVLDVERGLHLAAAELFGADFLRQVDVHVAHVAGLGAGHLLAEVRRRRRRTARAASRP